MSEDQKLQIARVCTQIVTKAFETESEKELIFVITNDTVKLFRYTRMILFKFQKGFNPALKGISSFPNLNEKSEYTQNLRDLAQALNPPKEIQRLTEKDFKKADPWNAYSKNVKESVLWIPIPLGDGSQLGLLIERPQAAEGSALFPVDIENGIKEYLIPGFSAAWKKTAKDSVVTWNSINRKKAAIILATCLVSSFFISVPLRVVAPCEIVSENPVYITAPLEGIIDEVLVEPGQKVDKGSPLVEYDKRVVLQNLKIAEKKLALVKAEHSRLRNQGFKDKKAQEELGILQLKLEKEKLSYDLANYYASKVLVTSETQGIVSLRNPEEWRGKPVMIGEKILEVNDPKKTRLKVWIPEKDNIVLPKNANVKVFLNIQPERGHTAMLRYTSNEVSMSPQNSPSFVSEASWEEQPEDLKLGLRGSAIIYGEKVSLFYFLFRKPLIAIRNFLGI